MSPSKTCFRAEVAESKWWQIGKLKWRRMGMSENGTFYEAKKLILDELYGEKPGNGEWTPTYYDPKFIPPPPTTFSHSRIPRSCKGRGCVAHKD